MLSALSRRMAHVDWTKVRQPHAYIETALYLAEISEWKRVQAQKRAQEREQQIVRELQLLENARAELAICIADYRTVCRPAETEYRWLDALSVLVGATCDADLRQTYGVSRDVVYQWRRRGLLLLQPDFSDDLCAHIYKGRLERPVTWKKGAAASRRQRRTDCDGLGRRRG